MKRKVGGGRKERKKWGDEKVHGGENEKVGKMEGGRDEKKEEKDERKKGKDEIREEI
jgi:hypothetical protein